MNTASVSLAVTPTVVSTLFSHYLNRKPLRQKPTAHISYDEGLHLIRSFLTFASHHTVEELQGFTSQWVPHPQWVRVDEVTIPDAELARAGSLLEEQLGPDGVKKAGGSKWWQWRIPRKALKAEWIEMRHDHRERERTGDPGNRVMFYVHGGAYFFGSVDEHRYQLQRHARKLKARAFAPRYRLSPQFPFPCGLHDCLAAYLYLLEHQDPSTIILAGDSAGGGMVMSLLVTLRDRSIPLPAGAVLISPWVDLTHSFPSVSGDCPWDYIPQAGFHHKPSRAWPPPDDDEIMQLKKIVDEMKSKPTATDGSDRSQEDPNAPDTISTEKTHLSVNIDGKDIEIKEQIQMYATNEMLSHPLVSPVMQPTLGGLPPLLIMVGGGEILRDEQIYLAHKCANPSAYLPPESVLDDQAKAQIAAYKPTHVQLQVWDDLCHVAPTLSFTRPAKYMYRSVAQFGAWALARAQQTEIDILDDDNISVISNSESDSGSSEPRSERVARSVPKTQVTNGSIGKAGDPLPPFIDHMIRQRVTRHGVVFPLPQARELVGCTVAREDVGVVKQGPVKKWLEQKQRWDTRFKHTKARVHKKRLRDLKTGYEVFPEGDIPPPSALAGRRKIGFKDLDKKRVRSLGLSLWALWGSKHDEATVLREERADKAMELAVTSGAEEAPSQPFPVIQEHEHGQEQQQEQEQEQEQEQAGGRTPGIHLPSNSRSRSRRRTVKDEGQVEGSVTVDENTPAATLLALRQEEGNTPSGNGLLSPDYVLDMGVTGKRPRIDGIAMPFSIRKDAETASMMTLASAPDSSRLPTPQGLNPSVNMALGEPGYSKQDDEQREPLETVSSPAPTENFLSGAPTPQFFTPLGSPAVVSPSVTEKPPFERFVTAEDVLSQNM